MMGIVCKQRYSKIRWKVSLCQDNPMSWPRKRFCVLACEIIEYEQKKNKIGLISRLGEKSDFLEVLIERTTQCLWQEPVQVANNSTSTYIYARVLTYIYNRNIVTYLPYICIGSRSFLDTSQDWVRRRTRISYNRLCHSETLLEMRIYATKDKVKK